MEEWGRRGRGTCYVKVDYEPCIFTRLVIGLFLDWCVRRGSGGTWVGTECLKMWSTV